MKSFCEGLPSRSTKSLEMLVYPGIFTYRLERIRFWLDFEDVLEPLQLLRNIGSLTLKSAGPEDVKSLLHFKKEQKRIPIDRAGPSRSIIRNPLASSHHGKFSRWTTYGYVRLSSELCQIIWAIWAFQVWNGLGKKWGLGDTNGQTLFEHAALTKLHTNPYRGVNMMKSSILSKQALYEARNFVDSWARNTLRVVALEYWHISSLSINKLWEPATI